MNKDTKTVNLSLEIEYEECKGDDVETLLKQIITSVRHAKDSGIVIGGNGVINKIK